MLKEQKFFYQTLVDILFLGSGLLLGSGSVNPHIFADSGPDQRSQNVKKYIK